MSVNCSSNSTVLHLIDTTGPGGAETVFVQLAVAYSMGHFVSIDE